jgi:hypothetical protein
LNIDKSHQTRIDITGLKAAFDNLDKWGCSPEQSVLILGLEKSA